MSLIFNSPLMLSFAGKLKVTTASLSICVEVFAIKLPLFKSETGRFSIALPLFFKVTVNSSLVGLALEIYAESIATF
ncbi:hypothetical protein [Jejuia pallidilutea]|uniref:hypothetical protein n=1 Tax=Jejuia pallidilutea TaxID=504487 RepID=UPI001EE75792|nr:hypothetical protein [Jejuia pallidilutea]